MAEEESGQEKTEEATPKRLDKAREEGQVARSRELGTTLLLMTGAVSMLLFGRVISERLQGVMRHSFSFDRQAAMDSSAMFGALGASINSVLDIVVLILALLMLAGVIGAIGLGGWLFSNKPLAPRLSRMNPLEGLKRMFSVKALVELFKALAKFSIVALVASLILWQMRDELLAISQQSLRPAMAQSMWIIAWSALGMSAATVLIAVVDVPFQRFDNLKKLRMTRQQVKDEFKESEGKPEVKSRVRQLQRELAQSRMMAAVPDADVVITNPEHFSVALKYNQGGQGAPVVVAKGGDEVAIKIREVANHNGVPLLPSPRLARALFFSTEIDDEIPAGLYLAVAQVLAFIFQLNRRRQAAGPAPGKVKALNRKLDIPADYSFDTRGRPL
ncbi:MAG: flagellar biosynthesis protein FlhB [Gammaproteobacteria bacterium]|nr:flagellar biosynthesis protein FlhB [Gammaproteobacteria bacterium]NND39451.1 flagellar biosynthesis protein FlhB [Pseudomonadales bacterium]NNM12264.1 flagellar biosynthesis protein FlhB [Pseudomonadales bacterium]RZV55392.1 MAG: flagellar biosynthesis protein FlhB [Pseudomonadales bacterium]